MENEKKEVVINILRNSTVAHGQHEEIGKLVITHEIDFVANVAAVESLVNAVRRSSTVLFIIMTNKSPMGKYLHQTTLGELFLLRLKPDFHEIELHFPRHRFHPYYELFVRQIKDHHLNEFVERINYPRDDAELIRWRDILNSCVDNIRKEVKGAAFKKKLQDYLRSINKNSRELRKYLSALFEYHPKLFGIRLDLTYPQWQGWPYGVDTNPVQYVDVKAHWKVLLKIIKARLPSDCLRGFAWKLEYSHNKSFNYHMLIFIDAASACANTNIVGIIGECWNAATTNSNGQYFNYNNKSAGIGMISREDTAQRVLLEDAVIYMTKTDYFIKLNLPGKDRSFGKGNMPKPIAFKPAKMNV